MTNTPKTAIIIEEDYKGEYIRYTLTRRDFARMFPESKRPREYWRADTVRPLVHISYTESVINSPRWKTFFSDMAWELPESDIESGNLAYVDPDRCSESLRAYVDAI